MKITNKFRLLVLEDIKNDPFFFKRDNLLRYKIPKDNGILDNDSVANKVTAVWDLRDLGAFKINNSNPYLGEFSYEFYLQILHPEFDNIYERLKANLPSEFIKKPPDWGWSNKKKGEFQFGKVTFVQSGVIRKKVFIALIDMYTLSPQAISIQTLKEKTGVKRDRIRIEISAINSRLKNKIGFYFKGSGKGYYTLEKFILHKK